MASLVKIVSGGQTGVDRGALQAARKCGLQCGGWCPPGRQSLGGPIPKVYPLRETPSERSPLAPKVRRSQRTEWNVCCSDATLILLPPRHDMKRDRGTRWTIACARLYRRPCKKLDLYGSDPASKMVKWIRKNSIRWLNVAGPSERASPGIERQTCDVLERVFERLRRTDKS